MQYNSSDLLTNNTKHSISATKLITNNWEDLIPDANNIRITKFEIFNIDPTQIKNLDKIVFSITPEIKIYANTFGYYHNGTPCLGIIGVSQRLNNIFVSTNKMDIYGIDYLNNRINILVKPSCMLCYDITYDTQ